MPKSPEVSVVNYAGRFAFLEATLVEWPNLLHSLRSDVLPFVAAGEEAAGHYQHLRSFAALRGTRPVPKVFAAIQAWARVHNLSDEWILDAAVQTIAAWHLSNRSEVKWHYLPDDLDTPIFTPDFGGQWLPPVMNWSTFKTEMDGAYRKQLRAYRETVAKLWGDNKPHRMEQARWTVLWQRGKSPEAIRRLSAAAVSVANIQTRVHEFAESIGLTLRAAKSGPRRGI